MLQKCAKLIYVNQKKKLPNESTIHSNYPIKSQIDERGEKSMQSIFGEFKTESAALQRESAN